MAESHELEERALAAMQDEVLAGKGVIGGVRAVLNLVRQEQERALGTLDNVSEWWLSHTAKETSNG